MLLSQVRELLKDTDRTQLEELIERFGEDVVYKYHHEGGDGLDSMEEAYQGQYDSDVDFAQSLAEDLGEIPKDFSWPTSYIDWEWAAKDLMMDYFEIDGHYFRAM